MPQELLLEHFEHRDCFGIPIVNKKTRRVHRDRVVSDEEARTVARWKELQSFLNTKTKEVRHLMQCIDFVNSWVLQPESLPKQSHVDQGVIFTGNAITFDEIYELGKKQVNAEATWLLAFTKLDMQLRRSLRGLSLQDDLLPSSNPFKDPRTLLRYSHKSSYTPYDDTLGFQCADWPNCKPAESFDAMKHQGELSTEELRRHCEGMRVESRYISACDDVVWLLKYLQGPGREHHEQGRVSIISVARMDRLGLLWQRSNLLVQQAGGQTYSHQRSKGVKFAWPNHYLIYGWIPAQCILKTFSVQQLKKLCKELQITPGDRVVRDPHMLLQAPLVSEKRQEELLADALGSMAI